MAPKLRACALLAMALCAAMLCCASAGGGGARKLLGAAAARDYIEEEHQLPYDIVTLNNNCARPINVIISYQETEGGPLVHDFDTVDVGDSLTTTRQSVGTGVFWKLAYANGNKSPITFFSNYDANRCLVLEGRGNVCGWVKHKMPTDIYVKYTAYACQSVKSNA